MKSTPTTGRPLFSLFCAVAMLCLADTGCSSHSPATQGPGNKHNILFLMVDDLRPELGAYGADHISSPHMDRLASESVLFERAYAQAPVCGPSRVSLLTGLRVTGGPWRTADLEASFRSLPGYFRDQGYYTVSLGKVFHHMGDRSRDWSEAPWRSEAIYHGEQDWAHYNTYGLWQDERSANEINPRSGRGPYFEAAEAGDLAYQDGRLARKAVSKLRELKERDRPFLLSVGFWRPHLPLNAPKQYWERYDRTDLPLAANRFRPEDLPGGVRNSREILLYGATGGWPDNVDFHRNTRHAYYASLSYVDRQIGKVLRALEELDLSENTTVVLIGDHGWHLGEHNFWGKHNLLDNATRVPFILKAPGYEAGRVSHTVELLDIYPTLCDLSGLPRPGHLEGKSLVPLLNGNGAAWDKPAFASWKSARNVITGRYSYTEWTDSGERMLFDHRRDPAENRNVAGRPEYRQTAAALSRRLHEGFPADFSTQTVH